MFYEYIPIHLNTVQLRRQTPARILASASTTDYRSWNHIRTRIDFPKAAFPSAFALARPSGGVSGMYAMGAVDESLESGQVRCKRANSTPESSHYAQGPRPRRGRRMNKENCCVAIQLPNSKQRSGRLSFHQVMAYILPALNAWTVGGGGAPTKNSPFVAMRSAIGSE